MRPDLEPAIEPVDAAGAVAACYPLPRQLRPHLSGPDDLVARWRREAREGYRLVVLRQDDRPVVLAGFRFLDNLVHGRHLYVDDLVTDEAERGRGLGGHMMAYLTARARDSGCGKLLLDTPLANVLGHRFYYRQGRVAGALRFNGAVADR